MKNIASSLVPRDIQPSHQWLERELGGVRTMRLSRSAIARCDYWHTGTDGSAHLQIWGFCIENLAVGAADLICTLLTSHSAQIGTGLVLMISI